MISMWLQNPEINDLGIAKVFIRGFPQLTIKGKRLSVEDKLLTR